MDSALNSQKYLLRLMSSRPCMADPSDLLGSRHSENALRLATSGYLSLTLRLETLTVYACFYHTDD